MASWRRARGFTLMEMMTVVVMIGILAMIGAVAYRKYVRAAHVEEAQNIVISIRQAEEAFFAENGAYLDVSGDLGIGHTYPAQNPGAFVTAWGAPCSWCRNPNSGWDGLAVSPSAPVYYGYAVIADAAQTPTGRGVGPNQTYQGKPFDVTALGAGGKPWYFVEADGNLSGDGQSFTHVYGMSGMTQIFVDGADR
jgi:prepilin-type N-terminal cleavage/methylation domain-containing protein